MLDSKRVRKQADRNKAFFNAAQKVTRTVRKPTVVKVKKPVVKRARETKGVTVMVNGRLVDKVFHKRADGVVTKYVTANVGAVIADRFYESVTEYLRLPERSVQKHITYVPFTANNIVIDLKMVNAEKGDAPRRWGLLLYYQYIDMLHDYKRRSSDCKLGLLESWSSFTDSLIHHRDYPEPIVKSARDHVIRVVPHVRNAFTAKGTDNRPIGEKLTSIHANVVKNAPLTSADALLYIMLARTMRTKTAKDTPFVFQKITPIMNERAIIVDALVYLSNAPGAKYDLYKRNGVENPKGAFAYKDKPNDARNALLSLDMSRFGMLKQFTANYYAYVHLVNLGDAGIYFSPERDVRSILVDMVRKHDDNQIKSKKLQDMNNTRNMRTKMANSFTFGDVSDLGVVTFDTRPLELVVHPDTMRVQVTNRPQHTPGAKKSADTSLGKHITNHVLNPVLTFNGNDRDTYTFATAQTHMSDKKSLISPYKQHMQKHLGDFLNATNCIQNDVVFASGDALACVGYLTAHVLMNSNCKLMWEDTRNRQVVYTHRTKASLRNNLSPDATHIHSMDFKFGNFKNRKEAARRNMPTPSPIPQQAITTQSKSLEHLTESQLKAELHSDDFQERYRRGFKKTIMDRYQSETGKNNDPDVGPVPVPKRPKLKMH